MCKANEKLELFSYILYKFTEMYSSTNISGEVSCQLSNTQIMKLLFFTCLESCNVNQEEYNEVGLFNEFNHFIAYPNGPVEIDIYKSIDIIPCFNYSNGRIVSFDKCALHRIINKLKQKKEDILNLIDNAVDSLKNRLNSSLYDTSKLIYISHESPEWFKVFNNSLDKNMDILNMDIKSEFNNYVDALRLIR